MKKIKALLAILCATLFVGAFSACNPSDMGIDSGIIDSIGGMLGVDSSNPSTNSSNPSTDNSAPSTEHVHTWQEGPVLKQATCAEKGEKVFYCECGVLYKEDIPTIAHSFTRYVSDGNGTCMGDGTKTATCDYGCGTTDTKTDVGSTTDHEYKAIVTPATCVGQGYTMYVCYCGDNYIDDFTPAKGHSYSETITPPTCIAQGYTTYSCECGRSKVEDYTEMVEHSFTEYTSNHDATCTQDGTKTAYCDYGCDTTDTLPDEGSKLGHTFIDGACACGVTEWRYTMIDYDGSVVSAIVRSVEELNQYLGGYSYDTAENLAEMLNKYDEEYFNHNALAIFSFIASRGGGTRYSYELMAPTVEDSVLVVNVEFTKERLCGMVGATVLSMATGCLEIDKATVAACISVEVYEETVLEYTTHTYGQLSYNEDYHWYACNCGEVNFDTQEVHSGGMATCQSSAICSVCGQAYGEQLEHNYEDNRCTLCGDQLESEGLEYTLNNDGASYAVTGIGTCTDTDLVIPSTYNGLPVTSIGAFAFAWCSFLASIEIPDSVTSIGDYAFYGCAALTSVVVGDSVTSITYGAFSGCTSLTSIAVSANNTAYQSVDGNLYTKDGKTLIQYAIGKTVSSFEIPNSVTSIGYYAFAWCSFLASIEIPDSVTSIGAWAFEDCTSLTSIEISDSVTSIGDDAFSGCTSLTSVVIGDSVTSIGESMFSGCTSLTNIEIPNSVTSIDEEAFRGCASLVNIDLPQSVGVIGDHAFASCTALMHVVIPDAVTTINYGAFEDCSSLTEVILPDALTKIGRYSFTSCKALPNIQIPEGVTSIEEYAFAYCYALQSVIIPSAVTSIDCTAFSSCEKITSITVDEGNEIYKSIDGNLYTKDESTLIQYAIGKSDALFVIPNTVVTIEEGAFSSCDSLTSVVIPDSVTSIGRSAFSYCDSLTSIEIPNSVTNLGGRVFYSCDALTSIVIGNSVTSLEYEVLSACPLLTSIEIPDSVVTIGEWAFAYNRQLQSMVIPKSVTRIGRVAFYNCEELTNIYYKGTAEEWKLIPIGDSNQDLLNATRYYYSENQPTEDGSWWHYVNGVPAVWGGSLGSQGLKYTLNSDRISYAVTGVDTCTDTDLVIPSTYNGLPVTKIGDKALYNCISLISVTIPDSVTNIGGLAFSRCASLTSITVSENNTAYQSIDGNLYTKDGKTLIRYALGKTNTSFIIPELVTNIGDYAFYGCTALTNIEIPELVTNIGDYAFYGCTALTNVLLPESLTSIGASAFYGCSSLTNVLLPESLTSIGASAFYGCTALTSIEIPNSVTSIGGATFRNCTSLTNILLPESLTSIGASAFYGCYSLMSIAIGDLVTSIGNYAFSGCTSLTSIAVSVNNTAYQSVDGNLYTKDGKTLMQYAIGKTDTLFTIPESVTSIGEYVFRGCTSLTSIEIPDSVTSIASSAFRNCTSLTDITVSENNTAYQSIDGNLYTKDGKTLIQYAIGKTDASFTIPESVTSIGGSAFYECISLKSVEIPNSVTSISSYAFTDCDSLTSVTFHDTTTWYWKRSGGIGVGSNEAVQVDVTDPLYNARLLVTFYDDYYWYKE